jgi:glycosyltransferase involved in cell wall biosynthesis
MERPLISFLISCYNQEGYVREALEGALSQTYSPLEIIISDDCSQDKTFEVVQKIAAEYKGPHTIRLNRNARNLGIGGNHNQAISLCRGELIIGAGGDDISLPERTVSIVHAWNDSHRKALILYSRCVIIDEDGHYVGETAEVGVPEQSLRFSHQQGDIEGFLRRRRPHVTGCAYAISRKLPLLFGPMPETVTYEDTALCFRNVLAGGLFTFIDAPLVKYRRHGQNVTFGLHWSRPKNMDEFNTFQRKRQIELDRFIEIYKCFAADAAKAFKQGLIAKSEYPKLMGRIFREGRRFELKRDLLMRPWLKRVAIFPELFFNTIRPREMLEHLPYLLPKSIYCQILFARNRLHRRSKMRLTEINLAG